MADRLRLALVFHQHQPAGSFPSTFQEVTERAYAPLVGALYRHPEVKATLHFSGPLLDWLEGNRPDVVGDLGDLLKRGQVELLTGGYYEPILVGVPRRDAVAQIRSLTDRIVSVFGHRPLGAWLTQRVWEPHLPSLLAEAGVAYTTLDEDHFLQAGLRREELGESFITEDQGFPLVVFPASARLRTLIPFKDVKQAVAELMERKRAGARLVVHADDGEKFGAWPGTFTRIHKENYLDELFTALVAQSHEIETITLENAWIFQKPARRVYLPGGTYAEMAEWAFDALAARRFAQARNALKDDQAALVATPSWRNFLAKYPEANALHKRMLMVSEELARRSILDSSIEVRQAQQNLWRAQGNDVYWHGGHGGVYLPQLRADAYGSLLKAERILAERRVAAGEQRDYDVDGLEEYLFRGNAGAVFVHVQGGCIVEWDVYASATNLVDTIARRAEGEHEVLRRAEKAGRLKIGKVDDKALAKGDVVRAKERGLTKLLDLDAGRRGLFQDSFVVKRAEPVVLDAVPYALTPQREARTVSLILEAPARALASVPGLGIRKDLRIADEGLAAGVRYRIRNDGDEDIALTFTSTANFALLSETNAADVISLGTRKTTPGKELSNRNVGEVTIHSETRHFDITLAVEPPAEVRSGPVYAVVSSDEGSGRVYEQTEITFSWPVELEPGEHVDLELRATAVGQLVEPEAVRPVRRRKPVVPGAAPDAGARARR